MKKNMQQCIMGILLLFLSCFSTIQAQPIPEIEVGNRTYSQVFDSLSTGLIPARIPYGILMDRVYGWAGLDEWNNGDTVTAGRLFQTWYDGEEAYINAANRPANYLAMRDTIDRMLYQVKLPVMAFAYQFGFIDSLALNDGRLSTVNGILTDNNNTSPYFSKQVNIAGLATEDVLQNKSYLLYFDPSIVFNNTASTIQSITVLNLLTNSQYVLTANNGLAIQFASSGINTLRFTIQLSNGSSYTTHQRINVKTVSTSNNIALRPVGPDCTPVSQLLTSTIPFQGYAETDATNSHADVHFYYHTISPTSSNCERVLRKPIIIVDGFDPQDTRSFDSLYRGSLTYLKSGAPTRLGDDLRDKGYDVIILNFPKLGTTVTNLNGAAVLTIPSKVNVNGTTAEITLANRDGGADYIERNAMLLVKLIQDVNATLAANGSTEKIVVVGPSMGGLISRYALSYMEKQQSLGVANMNHNCRVWVSFDSPHDGANISLGAQYTVRFFANFTSDQKIKDDYEKKLRATAARQQLIEQTDALNSTDVFHSTFYTNIKNNGLTNSGGFPLNVRKVNLLNGNGSGINTLSPGVLNLSVEGYKRILGKNVKVLDVENRFMPNYGIQATISNNSIYKLIALYFSTKTIINANSKGSMDAVQGSLNDNVLPGLKKGIDENPGLSSKSWYEYNPTFCFVPTISALGFKQPVANWHTAVNSRNLLCNNEINFDSYFLAPTNEKHIFLTEENVNWVMQEIEKGQPGCPVICSFELTGDPDIHCLNTASTYTLDQPAPSGTTVQWQVSPNLQINSSTNAAVTIQGTGSGVATITATILNPCGGNVVISKQITVDNSGAGSSYSFTSANSTDGYILKWCPGQTFSISLNGNGASNYVWSWPPEFTYQTGQGGNYIVLRAPTGTSPSTSTISVSFTDGCGTTTNKSMMAVHSCSPPNNPCFIVSPNPAQYYVNVNVESSCIGTTYIRQIELVNASTGTSVYYQNYSYGNVTSTSISMYSYPSGTYYVRVYDGSSWSSYTIIH